MLHELYIDLIVTRDSHVMLCLTDRLFIFYCKLTVTPAALCMEACKLLGILVCLYFQLYLSKCKTSNFVSIIIDRNLEESFNL